MHCSLFRIFCPQENLGFFSESARSCILSTRNPLSRGAGVSAPVIRDCARVSCGGRGGGEVQSSHLPLVFKSRVPRPEPQGAAPKETHYCSYQSTQSLLAVFLRVRAPLWPSFCVFSHFQLSSSPYGGSRSARGWMNGRSSVRRTRSSANGWRRWRAKFPRTETSSLRKWSRSSRR